MPCRLLAAPLLTLSRRLESFPFFIMAIEPRVARLSVVVGLRLLFHFSAPYRAFDEGVITKNVKNEEKSAPICISLFLYTTYT